MTPADSEALAVLDAEIASLPTMAALATHNGVKCDPADAVERLQQARTHLAARLEAAERLADWSRLLESKFWEVAERHNDRSCDHDVCREVRGFRDAYNAYRQQGE